jgi:hypothetical protein
MDNVISLSKNRNMYCGLSFGARPEAPKFIDKTLFSF